MHLLSRTLLRKENEATTTTRRRRRRRRPVSRTRSTTPQNKRSLLLRRIGIGLAAAPVVIMLLLMVVSKHPPGKRGTIKTVLGIVRDSGGSSSNSFVMGFSSSSLFRHHGSRSSRQRRWKQLPRQLSSSGSSASASVSFSSASDAPTTATSTNRTSITTDLDPDNTNSSSAFPAWSYEPRDFFRYEIVHQSTKPGSLARVGRIHTPHGIVDTPGYVAVATNAALKGVEFRDADQSGQQLIFSNTYHLMLHPGADIIEAAGGIHNYTNRHDRPFITDSGGFQVFSLAYGSVQEELASKGELKRASSGSAKNNRSNHAATGKNAVKVTEDGVLFRSYRDGAKIFLTPESTVEAQKQIGADIIIPLDELPPYHIDEDKLRASVERSHRWETRSLRTHLDNIQEQAMYCVVHGGINRTLRTDSVNYLTSLPFDGYAIGGSLGNGKAELQDLLNWMMPALFQTKTATIRNKPRHLLGIADEESIRHAVTQGIDTLDSCYPTRIARHGTILTKTTGEEGHQKGSGGGGGGNSIKIKSGKYKTAFGIPLEDNCTCSTCQHYDRAYLWHLFKANEPIAITLAAQHNIHYMNTMMAEIRNDILENKI